MKYILQQAALTFASFALLYGLVGGVSFLVFPDPSRGGVRDFQAAERTLFMTVPKYVFLGRSVLDGPGNKVLVVGASNAAVGFLQRRIQSKFECAQVSNLAIGGSNVSEVKQVIDLIHETQGNRDRTLNTFVISVWYGMFVDSEIKYVDPDRNRGDTDLDIERYRYGFYRRTPEGPVAVLPPNWLDVGVMMLRPLLLVEKAAREARSAANLLLTGRRSAQRTEIEREAAVMSEQEKRNALDYWDKTMGSTSRISEKEVDLLRNVIGSLVNAGETVLLVDLPIPAWHRDRSPYHQDYEQKIEDLSRQFKDRPNFVSMSMSDLDGNEDYSDEVHAKRHLANIWSDRLADVLNPLVCDKTAKPQASLHAPEQSATTSGR
ncbi:MULTISPECIES: hypothetical protein [Bradyrhizobium]|uniref:hypothetical protein n=1 Tax=Bradyrhizobium TaxID=374 RepID=UPI00293ED4C4|nr:hypothetical protein [Bradyrhizobium sp. BWC-3-1]WOH57342.1 hypothetical protein RX329_34775 [Bradyrhizobium sp. BWC-3-1]